MTDIEIEDLIKRMFKFSLNTANVNTKNIEVQRNAADVSCFSPYEDRNCASVKNAPEVKDVLETKVPREIEAELMGDVGGLQSAAPVQDLDIIIMGAISTRASFGAVADRFSTLE